MVRVLKCEERVYREILLTLISLLKGGGHGVKGID